MYRTEDDFTTSIDWITIGLYCLLVLMGWLNIYAATYDPEMNYSIFDLSQNSGKQLLWIGTSLLLMTVILLVDYKVIDFMTFVIYGFIMLVLAFVLVAGVTVNGSKSWLVVGEFRLQPAELAKFATALAMGKIYNNNTLKTLSNQTLYGMYAVILLPVALIVLQGDVGSAMVYSSFFVVMAILGDGLSTVLIFIGLILGVTLVLTLLMPFWGFCILVVIVGIIIFLFSRKKLKNYITTFIGIAIALAFNLSVNTVISKLKPHRQNRIKAFIDPELDPMGAGWNVIQSKIAIGSGGFLGKGFLEGTQTKLNYVPEQHTDFIFCTVGEEHGWVGSLLLILIYMSLFYRLLFLVNRQKTKFAKLYGLSVVTILFFHFCVNIGMTIGLFPVVGIPLPFFSYGGSSLWSFTILLSIFLNFDASRRLIL
ncbi:MAG: rod shape-determining protein RodA [Cytophagales bacterium]